MHAARNRKGDIHALHIRLHVYIQIGIFYYLAQWRRHSPNSAGWNQKEMAGTLALCWHARANTLLRVLSFLCLWICACVMYIALPISCSSTRRRATKKKEYRMGKEGDPNVLLRTSGGLIDCITGVGHAHAGTNKSMVWHVENILHYVIYLYVYMCRH